MSWGGKRLILFGLFETLDVPVTGKVPLIGDAGKLRGWHRPMVRTQADVNQANKGDNFLPFRYTNGPIAPERSKETGGCSEVRGRERKT